MSSFYVTLPSDSSMNLFPRNTQCCFTVKLPRPISIRKENWEVALAELIVPAESHNITRNNCGFNLVTKEASIIFILQERSSRRNYFDARASDGLQGLQLKIPEGAYSSPGDLVETMQKLIDDAIGEEMQKILNLKIGYSKVAQRVKITSNDKQTGIELPRQLAELLGYRTQKESIAFMDLYTRFPYCPDMNSGHNQMFIYSDVADFTFVGHLETQILRVVPVKNNKVTDGKHFTYEFANLHYVPVCKSNFDRIEINISGDTGESIYFAGGKSMVKLHFREKK